MCLWKLFLWRFTVSTWFSSWLAGQSPHCVCVWLISSLSLCCQAVCYTHTHAHTHTHTHTLSTFTWGTIANITWLHPLIIISPVYYCFRIPVLLYKIKWRKKEMYGPSSLAGRQSWLAAQIKRRVYTYKKFCFPVCSFQVPSSPR